MFFSVCIFFSTSQITISILVLVPPNTPMEHKENLGRAWKLEHTVIKNKETKTKKISLFFAIYKSLILYYN